MHLTRLGGLGAEAVDEGSEVGHPRLLLGLLTLLLGLPLGALELGGRVAAGIAHQGLVLE